MGMLDFLNPLTILTGPIERITNAIVQVQLEKAKAKTDADRIAAEERIKALEAKRDVLVAESGDSMNRFMRAMIAAPIVILLWKLFVFDKVFGQWLQWKTDPLGHDLWLIVVTVIGFYFVDSIASRLRK